MKTDMEGVSDSTPQFVRRFSNFNGVLNGFGKVHATRNGSNTICGKKMENAWTLHETLIKAIDEQGGYSSLVVFCEVCRNAKNSTNPSQVQEAEVGKNKKDHQKELLPMWDGKQKGTSYGTNGYGQAGFQYSGNTCTHNGTKPMCILGREISLAGSKGADVEYDAADIVIDCAGITKKDFNNPAASVVSGTARLVDAVKGSITHPDTLFIDWPDMKTPKVGAKFWVSLLEAIPDKSRVVICCMGSHGRTGTAMACLIAANSLTSGRENVPDAVDIIKFVRKNHCTKAIETQSQEDYVAKVVAHFKDPGNQEEVKRQWALNDAAFKKVVVATTVVPKVETQGKASEQASSKSLVPQKEESAKYEWVDFSPNSEASEQQVGDGEDIMFIDAAGNVVNENGDIVFEKGKLSAEEREWANALPTWGEYIAKRYEKGSNVANANDAEGGKNGN